MIEYYLKCDTCGKKFECYKNGDPKEHKKDMVFLREMKINTSSGVGDHTSEQFFNLFFCSIDCFNKCVFSK